MNLSTKTPNTMTDDERIAAIRKSRETLHPRPVRSDPNSYGDVDFLLDLVEEYRGLYRRTDDALRQAQGGLKAAQMQLAEELAFKGFTMQESGTVPLVTSRRLDKWMDFSAEVDDRP